MEDKVIKRIDELIKIINRASIEYYTNDNPSITDQEYDDYYSELLRLEEAYPNLKRDDSPTSRVGGTPLDKFEKVTHKSPMLSFDDIFNEDEIIAFDERIKKTINNPIYTVEPKMDGLSGSLIYEKGLLTRVATWGDGVVGENITANGRTIKSIPLRLNKDIDIEVRGEIYMSKASFERANKEKRRMGRLYLLILEMLRLVLLDNLIVGLLLVEDLILWHILFLILKIMVLKHKRSL